MFEQALFFGDSYTSGAVTRRWQPSYAQAAAFLLGWRSESWGRGGTGYVAAGSDGRLPYPDRLPALLALSPRIVVMQGSGNDAPEDLTVVEKTAAAMLGEVAARHLEVFVVGPMWAIAGRGHLPELNAAMAAATRSVGVPYIDALGWLTAGHICDGAHPHAAGHRYIGRRLAAEIRRVRR